MYLVEYDSVTLHNFFYNNWDMFLARWLADFYEPIVITEPTVPSAQRTAIRPRLENVSKQHITPSIFL